MAMPVETELYVIITNYYASYYIFNKQHGQIKLKCNINESIFHY